MKYFSIGKIVNTQGVHGELRVLPVTDDPKRFELLKTIQVYWDEETSLCDKTEVESFDIETIRYHKQFVILKLLQVDDMTSAEKLKNTIIKIPETDALPLDEDEYYLQDLIGVSVFTVDGEDLGMLDEVIFTGANDVYSVKTPDGKQLLIPAIKQCILNVNIAESKMIVNLLEGLR